MKALFLAPWHKKEIEFVILTMGSHVVHETSSKTYLRNKKENIINIKVYIHKYILRIKINF
jgi:hypothetical protein